MELAILNGTYRDNNIKTRKWTSIDTHTQSVYVNFTQSICFTPTNPLTSLTILNHIWYVLYSSSTNIVYLHLNECVVYTHHIIYDHEQTSFSLKLSKQSMFTYKTISRTFSILFYSVFLSSNPALLPTPSCNPNAITLYNLRLANSFSRLLYSTCSALHVGR